MIAVLYWGRECIFPVCEWFECPSSWMVMFQDHVSTLILRSCGLWLRDCDWLRSVGYKPEPCTYSGTLDLLLTDVSRVAVVTPLGNSEHSSFTAENSKAQTVPNVLVGKLVGKAQYSIPALAQHLVCWQTCWDFERASVPAVGCYIPTQVIRVQNKFDIQCIYGIILRVNYMGRVYPSQVRADEKYSDAKRHLSVRSRNVLMNSLFPHKWWSTI